MNIYFFGQDEYSSTVLKHLLTTHKSQIKSIITTHQKPKQKNTPESPASPKKIAKDHNIKTLYYNTKKDDLNKLIEHINSATNTLGILASFGHILPSKLINAFDHGIINLHPSLLPQYRGVTPVQHALALGDKTTGITLFKLNQKIDKGKILAQQQTKINPLETNPQLSHRLFTLGSQLLTQIINSSKPKTKNSQPIVNNQKSIYTPPFTRSSGRLSWPITRKILTNNPLPPKQVKNRLLSLRLTKNQKSTTHNLQLLFDLWRALTPWPGIWTIAQTAKGEKRIKLLFNLEKLNLPLNSEKLLKNLQIHLAGKPKPIPFSDFQKYYL